MYLTSIVDRMEWVVDFIVVNNHTADTVSRS